MRVSPQELTRLGLTTYEAKAYLALIRRDGSSAAEVAQVGNLPRQRIYDVLASLVQKGLASTRPGNPTRYAATPPELAIERLITDHRLALSQLERDAERLVEQLSPAFEAGQDHSEPLGYIEVLRERGAIANRFAELQDSVEREILVFTKPPYATAPQQNVQGLRLAHRYKSRSIYELSLFTDSAHVEAVCQFIEAGTEARFVPELPLKLAIIDETIVMFGIEDRVAGEAGLTIVVVEHPSLAKLLKIAFDTVWDQGLTFDEAATRAAALQEQTA